MSYRRFGRITFVVAALLSFGVNVWMSHRLATHVIATLEEGRMKQGESYLIGAKATFRHGLTPIRDWGQSEQFCTQISWSQRGVRFVYVSDDLYPYQYSVR
ncbi:MAG: hypothetical protein A3H72_03975 [Candidatus Doudnabacteria bacterium RIFCSPLOWO2_02_FULL_48_8]|uniref:Uncharacterized protein n=1 Tax=Candidatus Doudnabacteria bacterium RIFCSPHIGHO2_01_FULL_46_24 TaxID=1817825 RepID=A0A1F5NW07_9BACT|nr:MAG: hypothetical protein A2720_02185 [Candidatus Doudnabacteria bacterium RIFCSPHIGHO2_01_FULL_46_24]OGE95156.1 MAG: hypothetical protein A3H72_03975 [Candidatus Doudnabacteria bacterium RIFCSPLOWO2_02_FULL_48_8]OGE95539.1 MAG: hypothetical protein A3E98_01865 [Candidatus Doudnabacteria bacterium RIFCSPHIGHO2_12_FULL_48_11]